MDSIQIVPVESLPGSVVERLRRGANHEIGPPPSGVVPLLVWTGCAEDPLPITTNGWSTEAKGMSLDAGLTLAEDVIGSPVTVAQSGRLVGIVVPTEQGMMVAAVSARPTNTE